jgi:tape measure domain-containing protein
VASVTGGSVLWNLDIDDSKFNQKADAAAVKAKTTGDAINKVDFSDITKNASEAFGGIADTIQSVITKIALVGITGSLGLATFVDSAAGLQQTSQAMQVVIGNTQVANQLFGQLLTYTNKSPFQFAEVSDAAKTLLGFGVAAGSIMPTIRVLGDVAGITGAQFSDLSRIYGEVNAQGKLEGLQALELVRNNVPIYNILAASMHVSLGSIRDDITKGTITSQVFDKAMQDATASGGEFFNGTQKLADTFNGRMSTLKDAVLEFGRNLIGVKVDPQLGLVIKPGGIFDLLSQSIPKITADLQTLGPRLEGAFAYLVAHGQTVIAILAAVGAAFVVAKLAVIAFGIQSVIAEAAATGGLSLIPLAFVAVAAALTFLQVKFDIFGKAFTALKPIIDPVIAALRQTADILGKELAPVFQFASDHAEILMKILGVIVAVALAPMIVSLALLVAAILVLPPVLRFVIGVFNDVVGTILAVDKVIFGLAGAFISVGSNIIGGIVTGLRSAAGDVVNEIEKICGSALDAVKKFFGIHSPSTVMAGVGGFIMQGLAQGIAGGASGAVSAATTASAQVLGSFTGSASSTGLTAPNVARAGTALAASASGSAGGVTIHLHQSGIVARSRSDFRDIMKDGIAAVNEELTARGLPLIANGQVTGSSTSA